jgi:hypothetical protein
MYDIAGLREWLLSKGIDGSNVGAVYEFGLVAEGVEREPIGARCVEVVTDENFGWRMVRVEEAGLRGVGREVAKGLALACARHEKGRRLGWRYVRRAYRMLEGWMRANGGAYGGGDNLSWFQASVAELDVCAMPLKALREVIEGSKYADRGWAAGVIERKEAAGDNAYEVEYRIERRYDMGDDFISSDEEYEGIQGIECIALDNGGDQQRMAVIDLLNTRAVIFDVESGERLATAGSEGEGPGAFEHPSGLAFSDTGELYVSNSELGRITVLDRQGRYVRSFGGLGGGQGQFGGAEGLCFTTDGDLVVADSRNNRLQVFRQDGTFVRAIGSHGSENGQFDNPRDVCCRPDGSIAVVDTSNHRVQVFDKEWGFVRSFGSKGDGPGQFLHPFRMAVGKGGEIIVTDFERKDVQVFSAEGELLQIIGAKGDSDDMYQLSYHSIAADAEGRLIVALNDCRTVVVLS